VPIATCAFWAIAAIVSGLLSMSGFVVAFDLVFGAQLTWRQSAVGGLRGLGATVALPAGALFGPAAAASSVAPERQPSHVLARSAVALTILTNAPTVIALTLLGLALSLGLTAGAHDALRTLFPAAIGAAIVAATLLAARTRDCGRRGRIRAAIRALKGGALDARVYLASGDWRLLGALANSAFDGAVLVIAFHAVGHPQPLSAVTMGYLVGSLGGAIPVPGGLGAVEGGLIGALVLYGAPPGPAAAAVLLYRAITLLFPTVLGVAAWGAMPLARMRRGAKQGEDLHDKHQQGVPAC
jgi:uncharacterized membrane protein YbhN (UPF0104 family)